MGGWEGEVGLSECRLVWKHAVASMLLVRPLWADMVTTSRDERYISASTANLFEDASAHDTLGVCHCASCLASLGSWMGIGRLRIDIAHWNGIRTVNHYQMLGYADQCWPFRVLGAYSFFVGEGCA